MCALQRGIFCRTGARTVSTNFKNLCALQRGIFCRTGARTVSTNFKKQHFCRGEVTAKTMSGGQGCFPHQVKVSMRRVSARASPERLQQSRFRANRLPPRAYYLRDSMCAGAHRDSQRVGTRRGTPGEGSPRQNSPPDCFDSPPALFTGKEFRPVRRATKGFAFGFHHL